MKQLELTEAGWTAAASNVSAVVFLRIASFQSNRNCRILSPEEETVLLTSTGDAWAMMQMGSRSRSGGVLLGLACALLVLQALPWFSGRWVEDESWYSIRAWTLLTEGRIRNVTFAETDRQFEYDASPPGMPLVLAAAFKTGGVGVWQARLPSLLAACGLVVLVFYLGTELGGPLLGGLAALLVASDNFLFLAARCVRPEALVTFLGTLAILLYFMAKRHRSVWLSFASGVALGCSMNMHVNGLPAALSIASLMIAEFRLTVWRQPRAWAAALGIALCALPTAYAAVTTPAYAKTISGVYGGYSGLSLSDKLARETQRYGEFLGLVRPGKGIPYRVPLRAHVAVLAGAAFLVLYRRNRELCVRLLILLLPVIPWWAFMVNKSARYLVLASPYIALAMAAAAISLYHVKWRPRVVTALLLVFAGTQLAGNALLVNRFRLADYSEVARKLRTAIPDGASATGNIVFWLALYDHPYTSYVRSPFEYTVGVRKPTYWILNDRVMVQGDGTDDADTFAGLRAQSQALVAQQGELVARIPSSFYGDLQVYRVHYGDQPPLGRLRR